MHKLYKRFQIPLKTIIKMAYKRIHENYQSHQEFIRSTSRLHQGHKSYQELMKQYMDKSSWSSTFSRIYERVFNKVHQDHELHQKFRKEYMEGFARIINCPKDFESVCDNHQSYWGFMKENIQGIKWITNLFYRFLKRYEKPFSLSIISKEFLRWWAEIFILCTWPCIREGYLNPPISPRIIEQLTDLNHYAKVII
jgi:hypothetical protein